MTEKDLELAPLPWQKAQWEQLIQRGQSGCLPHALLFSGPQGLGKLHLARLLAQTLLCDQDRGAEGPCENCRSCRLFAAGSHPDYQQLQPEEAGKDLTIGQIRTLIERLALKSQYGRHRFAVLEPADALNTNSANALLKTLEEPGEGTVLILLSSQPSRLLPTIRSRCQAYRFSPPARDEAAAWVAARNAGSDALLAFAGNAPLLALELADQGWLEVRDGLAEDFAALAVGKADPVRVAGRWAEQGVSRLLDQLYGFLGDLIRLKLIGTETPLVNRDLMERFNLVADRVDLDRLLKQLERLERARRRAGGSVNAQLMLEDWCIGWSQ